MRSTAPDVLPLLARGKHRNPRRGACFMELASYLAGERWSDHPACTHPVLARLARAVNDATSDDARPRLARHIPSVIGLTSTDPRWDHELAVLAACAALPVAAEERQRVLAVGLLTCERLVAADEGRDPDDVRPATRAALDAAPLAARWAERFTLKHGLGRSTRAPSAAVVDFAVQALALSTVPDTDARLADLLDRAIAMCRTLAGADGDPTPQPDGSPWAELSATTPRLAASASAPDADLSPTTGAPHRATTW